MYLVLSVLIFLIPTDGSREGAIELDLDGDIEPQQTQGSHLSMSGSDFSVDFSKYKTSDIYKDSVIQTMWQDSKES